MLKTAWRGGQARVRTLEAIRQQIYSLPPLSTWVPARPTFHSENKIQPCRQIEHISGCILFSRMKIHSAMRSSLRETDGWIAEENEDWPGIESIRFY